MGNPLIFKKNNSQKFHNPPNQSKGILDDFAVRKNVATQEGSIERTPTNDNHIANKKYVDDAIAGLGLPLSHTNAAEITDVGTNTHAQIDSHISGTGTAVHGDSYLLNTGDTATGNYNFDSNTFYIDATNNRIGVRTATPSYAVDIQGDTALLLNVARSDSGTTALFSNVSATGNWGRGEELSIKQLSNTNNAFSALGFRSYGGTLAGGLSCVYPTMASNYGKLFLSSRGPSGFQTNNLVVYDGKVGVMNASPSEVLSVTGNVTADAYKFNTAKTYYYSKAGNAFHATNDEEANVRGISYFQSKKNDLLAYATVELPHGAVVTSVNVRASSNTPVYYLNKYVIGTGSTQMATAACNTADTTITSATIDNQSPNTYSVQVNDVDTDVILYGIFITYTMTTL